MSTTKTTPLIFIHGKESSGQGYKGNLLRQLFPHIKTPNFQGDLTTRLSQLETILQTAAEPWVIIGSSMGGLMGSLYAHQHPAHVQRLILLAPALTWAEFADQPPQIDVPTTIYHGRRDTVIPFEPASRLARQSFSNLTFHAVDDDHLLRPTVSQLDWVGLVQG